MPKCLFGELLLMLDVARRWYFDVGKRCQINFPICIYRILDGHDTDILHHRRIVRAAVGDRTASLGDIQAHAAPRTSTEPVRNLLARPLLKPQNGFAYFSFCCESDTATFERSYVKFGEKSKYYIHASDNYLRM